METKKCNKCSRFLPITSFSKDRTKTTGVQSQCVQCKREATRKHYKDNKDQYLKNQQARRQRNRLQQAAHNAVARAVKTGKLVRPSKCTKCGCDKSRIEAHHHNGYEKDHWIDVVFICTSCHRHIDRLIKN